jgi:hypothetical protein
MSELEYGKKIGMSYKAILQMHRDAKKLLVDCDNFFTKKSIFGNTVTSSLSYSINASYWLAQGLFRYWPKKNNIINGITIVFFADDEKIDQPLFIAGIIKYKLEDNKLSDVCKFWDLWNAALSWSDKYEIDNIISLTTPGDEGRIEKMSYIIKPLFQINEFRDVKEIFSKLKI